jgi:hypothetical protein
MKITRSFISTDRYVFDFGECTTGKGFAQIDTSQDAWYFGTWANPFSKKIVSYCEGDVTVQFCESPQEFSAEIRKIKTWNEKNGWRFIGIDPGYNIDLQKEFVALGLLSFMH